MVGVFFFHLVRLMVVFYSGALNMFLVCVLAMMGPFLRNVCMWVCCFLLLALPFIQYGTV